MTLYQSRITRTGSGIRVETEDMVTTFRDLDSAATQIGLLHGLLIEARERANQQEKTAQGHGG